jgi:hypothetical protein
VRRALVRLQELAQRLIGAWQVDSAPAIAHVQHEDVRTIAWLRKRTVATSPILKAVQEIKGKP